jgi:hypothetical protein
VTEHARSKGGTRRAAQRRDAFLRWGNTPLVRLTAAAAIILATAAGFVIVNLGHKSDHPAVDTRVPDKGVNLEAESRQPQPVAFAGGVLNTWAERGLKYDAWWAKLSPLLTPGAREAYAFTDPKLLPTLRTIKYADMVQGPSANTLTVYFDTGGGKFGIDVSRRDASSPWRAARVVFPGTKSMFG